MSKEYLKLLEEGRQFEDRYRSNAAKKEELAQAKIFNEYATMKDAAHAKRHARSAYSEFCNTTKKKLLNTVFDKLFTESYGYIRSGSRVEGIKTGLIERYINENGVDSIISKFKKESDLLAEFAYIIEGTYNKILEEVDEDDATTFVVDEKDRDDFYDELDLSNMEDVTSAIKMRVNDSMNKFIDDNAKDKMALEDIMKSTEDKTEDIENEEIKESYEMIAKRKMASVRNRPKSVFEAMVYTIAESARKDEKVRAVYTEGNMLDMDSIIESVTAMYTFVEMLNTAKICKIDEAYIKNMIDSLKV